MHLRNVGIVFAVREDPGSTGAEFLGSALTPYSEALIVQFYLSFYELFHFPHNKSAPSDSNE